MLRPIALAAALASAAPASAAAERPVRLGFCASCHLDDGRGGVPGTPRLAGQDLDYLREALHAYRRGDRRHAAMRAIAGALGERDIDELARWYAAQPCRAP